MRKLEWDGYFYDGNSAKKNEIKVRIISNGIQIRYPNGDQIFWQYSDIRESKELYSKNKTYIENILNPNQKLIVDDFDFFKRINEFFPDNKTFLNRKINNSSLRRIAVIGTVLILLFIPIFFKYILPVSSGFIAKKIPISFEKNLSKPYFNMLVPKESSCNNDERFKEIESIFNMLTSSVDDSPYDFNLHIIKSGIINAFALPGGDIVIYSKLIEKTTRPEQLAGVLAHEIQHITNQHGMESLIRDYSLSILISALTGNTNNTKTTLGFAKFLGLMNYSRVNEKEADIKGIKLMKKAKLDPKGMVEFFEILKKNTGDIPNSLEYVSTHPQTSDRVRELKNHSANIDYKPRKLFSEKRWQEIKKICDDETIEKFYLF